MKEKWFEEFRYRKVKLDKARMTDQRIKNNRMFKEDEGMFYKKTNKANERKGKVPKIEKFVEFWAGIWEDKTTTPYRKWIKTIAEKIKAKVTNVEELQITEKKLYETLRKRKNWSAPGIDGIQNFWWKKLSGVWKALIKSMNRWIEEPETIPK